MWFYWFLDRFDSGIPSTLNYVKIPNAEESPPLIPYPSWNASLLLKSEGSLADNSSIVSTFRIRVDECDRLWVMDASQSSARQPALVIFDLNTDRIIRRYTFKPNEFKANSLFANVVGQRKNAFFVFVFTVRWIFFYSLQVIDIPKNKCENAFAYATDLIGNGVVVYSYKNNRSWLVKHSFFLQEPRSNNFNVSGLNFRWDGGVIGMALGKQSIEGYS